MELDPAALLLPGTVLITIVITLTIAGERFRDRINAGPAISHLSDSDLSSSSLENTVPITENAVHNEKSS